MASKALRKSRSVFPIGTVIRLTDLTARQIRYYEEKGLISPKRTDGNRRLYSLDDVDLLLDIKDMLEDGLSIEAIHQQFQGQEGNNIVGSLTDEDVRQLFHQEFLTLSRLDSTQR
ncbi:MerR family transcriptional regulator [Atopobacter sp. AH10]|uniref:MerR family transcriptional regulator n=1 Tax=Atopobacter sp. AH10 TaxID=2315861 RepID=UPI000EF248D0|nr:MerR family transcriptional regulator [Atopobacter sp. AH10]RLK62817.1 MerR family transcriptional regulator [Atopobacter sp. AH10]